MPYMSIRDDSHPYLVLANDEGAFAWNTGFMYALMLESTFMRINSRGIQHSQTPLMLREASWQSSSCRPTRNAFCAFSKHEDNHTTDMLLFPTTAVDIPDNYLDLNPSKHPFLKDFAATHYSPCTYKNSNRAIKVGDDRYEVSLCDILDANLDFILDLEKNIIHWRQNQTSTLLYFLYAMLAIYLISLMTNNIINILTKQSNVDTAHPVQKDADKMAVVQREGAFSWQSRAIALLDVLKNNSYVIFLLMTLVFLSVMAINKAFVWQTLATEQDQYTVLLLCVYVYVQFLYHYAPSWCHSAHAQIAPTPEQVGLLTPGVVPQHAAQQNTRDDRDKSFSLLVAFLLLLIMLVYESFDTPYLTLMTTLFVMRSWLKLFLFRSEFKKAHMTHKIWLSLSTSIDFFVALHLLLLVESSMKSASSLSSTMYANLHLFTVAFTAYIVALSMKTASLTFT